MAYTNLQLAAFAQAALAKKTRYWFGTFGQTASASLYNNKKSQYPTHYTAARAATYKQHIADGVPVADCAGLLKWFFWSQNGARASKYADGFPDVNANTIIKSTHCEKSGSISSIPEMPGLVLWTDGHLGIYIGNGYAIEARGFAYGVVKTKVKDRTWKKWGKLKAKYLSYVAGSVDTGAGGAAVDESVLGSRILRYKSGVSLMNGSDVLALQTALVVLGFGKYLGTSGADGWFGQMTDAAVRAFQKAHNLEVDGEYGPKSHAKLSALLAAGTPEEPENPEPLNEDDLPPLPVDKETGEDVDEPPAPPDNEEAAEPDAHMGAGSVNPYPIPTKDKKKGNKGAAVKWIQFELKMLGYDIGKYGPDKDGIDGDFGSAMDKAVRKYQKAQKLAVDGIVGQRTRAALLAGQQEDTKLPPAVAVDETGRVYDVSSYDGDIDWAKVASLTGKQRCEMIIMRAQASKPDAKLARNIKGCKQYGIPYGVYAYTYASNAAEGRADADRFYERVMAAGGEPLCWVIDAEEGKNTKATIEAMRKQLRGHIGLQGAIWFYSFDSRVRSWSDIMVHYDGIWTARWNTPAIKPGYKDYDLWQFGYTNVPGIRKTTDTSRRHPDKSLEQILARRVPN